MIVLNNLTLQRGTKVLLDAASVTINPGEKVALVGRNGAGKSSLFGLLNGSLHEDAGDFAMPAHWRKRAAHRCQKAPTCGRWAHSLRPLPKSACLPRGAPTPWA